MVPENGTEPQAEQSKPVTRFQKVASALRGDKPDQTQPETEPTTDTRDASGDTTPAEEYPGRDYWSDKPPQAQPGAEPAAEMDGERDDSTPTGDYPGRDYWDDESSKNPDGAVAVTQPDGAAAVTQPDGLTMDAAGGPGAPAGGPAAAVGGPAGPAGPVGGPADTATAAEPGTAGGDHAATMPDVFGTASGPGSGLGSGPGSGPGSGSGSGSEEASADSATTEPEVPAAGRHAAAAAAGPDSGPGPVPAEEGALRPGQASDALGDLHDLAYGNLIPEAAEFRAQWQQIQFKFVDDPQASVGEAAHVVAQVTAKLEAAIQERQRIIQERQRALRDRWSEGANADTETLRETLRLYRGFLDQLLGSRS